MLAPDGMLCRKVTCRAGMGVAPDGVSVPLRCDLLCVTRGRSACKSSGGKLIFAMLHSELLMTAYYSKTAVAAVI